MGYFFMKKNLSVFYLGFLSLLFVSCSGFMNSSDLLNRLEEVIEYNSKPFVTLKIDAPNSCTESIIPSAGEYIDKYKCGDTITLSFVSSADYQFQNWTVTPENAVTFIAPESTETTATINVDGEIIISPLCSERLKVISSSPSLSKIGADRGADIQIVFNQPVSEHSIYWTEAELLEKGINNSDFEDYKAQIKHQGTSKITTFYDENNNQYYYAYKEGDKVYYKNIEILIDDVSVLNKAYFGVPYLESTTLLIIPTVKKEFNSSIVNEIPQGKYITFSLNKGFESIDRTELYEKYVSVYNVGTHYDTTGPHATSESVLITGSLNSCIDYNDIDVYISTNSLMSDSEPGSYNRIRNYENLDMLYSSSPLVKPVKSIILYEGKAGDDAGIVDIILNLDYMDNKIFPSPDKNHRTVTVVQSVSGATEINFHDNPIIFDVSELDIQGIYDIEILGKDSLGNLGQIDLRNSSGLKRDVQCIIDNKSKIEKKDLVITKNGIQYNLSGPKGKYTVVNTAKEFKNSNGDISLRTKGFWSTTIFYLYTQPDTLEIQNGAISLSIVDDEVVIAFEEFLHQTFDKFPFLFAYNEVGNCTLFEIKETSNSIDLEEFIPPKDVGW